MGPSTSSATVGAAATAALLCNCHGFTAITITINGCNTARRHTQPLYIYAPPGSGYVRSSDATDEDDDLDDSPLTRSDLAQISPPAFPSTYEPMLEYPGTMRPGRTPENMPYHDLPNLGIDDPDPVPWPHFQEIEWHHRWDPPHPQALAMEEFIEVQGRWASVEEEAQMRMGMRRGVRERRETEELAGKGGGASGASGAQQIVIMDDEEEDEGGGEDGNRSNIGIGLGEGVEALLTTAAENAARGSDDDESLKDEDEDASDDFLLDLGLGGDSGDEEANEQAEEGDTPSKKKGSSKKTAEMEASVSDVEGEDDDDMDVDLDLNFELGFDLDEDDGDNEDDEEDEDFDDFDDDEEDISLDDYTKEDDGGDDDEFDDGGFDYGD